MAIPWKVVAIGGAAVLLLGGGTVVYVYGGAPKRSGVDRDPKKLLKPFAGKINTLFRRMRARGFQPMLWEGHRSTDRAAELAKQGTGIKRSMHVLGAAVDIVDSSTPNPWKASSGFWAALGQESRKLGLVWGGDWTKRDFPHVQAITVRQQTAFRKMTPAQRVRFVA